MLLPQQPFAALMEDGRTRKRCGIQILFLSSPHVVSTYEGDSQLFAGLQEILRFACVVLTLPSKDARAVG
jgi:hypothetical protein